MLNTARSSCDAARPLAVVEIGEEGGMPTTAAQGAKDGVHNDSIARSRAGVKIAMGTDAGVMPHGTNLREMGLMVNIGMTPMERSSPPRAPPNASVGRTAPVRWRRAS